MLGKHTGHGRSGCESQGSAAAAHHPIGTERIIDMPTGKDLPRICEERIKVSKRLYVTMDGNEAVGHVAYRTNEVIVIYPITPSSPMGEWADDWAARGLPTIWWTVPSVVEMQS